jgi:hypothetical protein
LFSQRIDRAAAKIKGADVAFAPKVGSMRVRGGSVISASAGVLLWEPTRPPEEIRGVEEDKLAKTI